MPNIKITTSSGDIQKAINTLKNYKKEIKSNARKIVSELMQHGLEVCRALIVEMDINDKGNLLNSVDGYYSAALNAGFIRINCDYACFVEFGTGVIGKGKTYPAEKIMAGVGYRYMGGTHYVTLLDGRVGWYYPVDNGRVWRFTEGMPSRPFAYETAQNIRRSFENIAKEVFN